MDRHGKLVSDQISAVVVSDSARGDTQWRRAADALGIRMLGAAPGQGALTAPVRFDVALVDIEHDSGDALDDLLDELECGAHEARYRSVIATTLDLIDPVAARITHRDIELLCAPCEAERAAALGLLSVSPPPVRLHEPSRQGDGSRLLQLSEEVARIARSLAHLSQANPATGNGGSSGKAPFADGGEPAPTAAPTPEAVRAILRARRARGRFFDETLFADPAWDMLLDLMEARLRGREVAVSSLCIAAAVPPTTALRWIRTLTERGLFVRRADPEDGRRVFIELSDAGAEAMHGWFVAVMQGDGLPFA